MVYSHFHTRNCKQTFTFFYNFYINVTFITQYSYNLSANHTLMFSPKICNINIRRKPHDKPSYSEFLAFKWLPQIAYDVRGFR